MHPLQATKLNLLQTLLALLCLAGSGQASGIFEINLAALSDSYGRDLRLDCCAWQNLTNQQQQQALTNVQQFHNSNQQQQQQQSCDPTKCQLIIRICVKNYQTQIDPSQCTFGELTAQVAKPREPTSDNQIVSQPPALSSFSRLAHQQHLTSAFNKLRPSLATNNNNNNNNALSQRLLAQQAHEAQHSRLFGPSASSSPPSGQARTMRQIAFDQPISFPFNFTWPVST